MRVLAALEVRERRTERICRRWQKQVRHTLPTCRERVSSWSRVTLRSRTVVENRTPGKRCSRIERSILANCTWPPTKMNCDFPGFNLRRFEDNQAPITSEYIVHFQFFHKLLKTLLFGRAWERLRIVTLKGRYKLI